MAGKSEQKVYCPTCGASSKTEGFGRDGSPRELVPRTTPKSMDPLHVKRRARAETIKRRNANFGQRVVG